MAAAAIVAPGPLVPPGPGILNPGSPLPGASPSATSFDTSGAINALSSSPDGSLIVVGGREVFKIVSVDDDGQLRERLNLRVGRINLNFSTIDAKWHPAESCKNLIATAATNGAVVVWNLHRAGGSKQDKIFTEHTRTVNRVCWRPADTNVLVSGSQDGLIKLWDIREGNCKQTFNCKAESVRDVQFSPFYPNYFAAGFDSGAIQVWDIRKPSTWERQVSGHNGLVLAVDWHPDDKSSLASAGRDRTIKIWDLNDTSKPRHTIQTIASVSRIQWRPGFKSQIASAAHMVDFRIHVWDLNRPYIPQYSLIGHKDVVTGFSWHKGQSENIISSSKDSMIMYHPVRQCYRPLEHVPTTAISWKNPRGDIAMVNDLIDRRPPEQQQLSVFPSSSLHSLSSSSLSSLPSASSSSSLASLNSPSASSAASIASSLSSALEQQLQQQYHPEIAGGGAKGVVRIFSGHPQPSKAGDAQSLNNDDNVIGYDSSSLQFFAENYKLDGSSPQDLCKHNASIALSAGNLHLHRVWSILSLLIDSNYSQPPSALSFTSSAPAEEEKAANQPSSLAQELSSSSSSSSSSSNSKQSRIISNSSSPMMQPSSNDSDIIMMRKRSQSSIIHNRSNHSSAANSPAMYPQSSLSSSIPKDDFFHNHMHRSSSASALPIPHASLSNSSSPVLMPMSSSPSRNSMLMAVAAAAAVASTRVSSSASPIVPSSSSVAADGAETFPPSFSLEAEGAPVAAAADPSSVVTPPAQPEKKQVRRRRAPILFPTSSSSSPGASASTPVIPAAPQSSSRTTAISSLGSNSSASSSSSSSLTQIVNDLLDFHSELGDVQTCSCVLLVLGDLISNSSNGPDLQRCKAWFFAYIELLQSLRLWECATRVIRLCPYPAVHSMNQKSTTIYVTCGHCAKPVLERSESGPTLCPTCKKSLSTCSICQQSVSGMYVWCQGCGHGGHVSHLMKWFSSHSTCPICNHSCSFKPSSASTPSLLAG